MDRPTGLLDQFGQHRIPINVVERDGLFAGTLDVADLSQDALDAFSTYEALVNDQTFSLLDEAELRVERLGYRAAMSDGSIASIIDLQVYPTSGTVSFRLAQSDA